jgi:signal transduction histidine kinase
MFAARPELSAQFHLNSDAGHAAVFRYAGDAMVLLDTRAGDLVVADLNPAAVRLLRAEVDPAAGFPFRSFYSPQQPDGRDSVAAANEYSRRAARGETLRYAWRFLRGDQTPFDADITLSRIGDSEDDPQLVIMREATAGPAAETACLLRQRTAQLDSLASEFDAFSYAVSHDLRAAISGIAACSRVVMDDFAADMNEEARRWLAHIHEDAGQLDKLTEALLELSRVSLRTFDPVRLDLTSMASEVMRELAAADPGSNPEFIVSEGLEAYGDPSLVRILLHNLLDNARKATRHTVDGRIAFGRVANSACERGPVFYIKDNGVGFDMTYAARLFVPFQRLHCGADAGGNGIGLAVVRRIAHRHGGEVWAEGTPGGGAAFFFKLDGNRS